MKPMTNCLQLSRPEDEVYKSLALAALFQELQENGNCRVLDLGAASGANFDFWSRFSSKLYFADFYGALQSNLHLLPPVGAYEQIFAKAIPVPLQTRFDVVLTWDLFNYLEIEALKALIGYLKQYCRPGTIVFTMISFLQSIPSEPRKFKILGPDRLLYESGSAAVRPCPRYQPRDINLAMGDFCPLNSFLLRHGIQEYLFAYRQDPS